MNILQTIVQTIVILLLMIFGYNGIYFSDFDYIVCTTPSSCIHEEGHRLDAQLGFPSQTVEFKKAVDEFPTLSGTSNSCIIETDFCFYSEAYAILWQAVKGNINDMPENFREFYLE